MGPKLLGTPRSLKTCNSFGKKRFRIFFQMIFNAFMTLQIGLPLLNKLLEIGRMIEYGRFIIEGTINESDRQR